jgi:hypothetical protein
MKRKRKRTRKKYLEDYGFNVNKKLKKKKREEKQETSDDFYFENNIKNNLCFNSKYKFRKKINMYGLEQINESMNCFRKYKICSKMNCVCYELYGVYIDNFRIFNCCFFCLISNYTIKYFDNIHNGKIDLINDFCVKIDKDMEFSSDFCIGSLEGKFGLIGYVPIMDKNNFIKLNDKLVVSSNCIYCEFYTFPKMSTNGSLEYSIKYGDFVVRNTYKYNSDFVLFLYEKYKQTGKQMYLEGLFKLAPLINSKFPNEIILKKFCDIDVYPVFNNSLLNNDFGLKYGMDQFLNLVKKYSKKKYKKFIGYKNTDRYKISCDCISRFLLAILNNNMYDFLIFLPMSSYLWTNNLIKDDIIVMDKNYLKLYPKFGIYEKELIPLDFLYVIKYFLDFNNNFNFEHYPLVDIIFKIIPGLSNEKNIMDKIRIIYMENPKIKKYIISCYFCTMFNCYNYKIIKFRKVNKIMKFYMKFNSFSKIDDFIFRNVFNNKIFFESIIMENVIWVLTEYNLDHIFEDQKQQVHKNCSIIRSNKWLSTKKRTIIKLKKIKRMNLNHKNSYLFQQLEKIIKNSIFNDITIQELFCYPKINYNNILEQFEDEDYINSTIVKLKIISEMIIKYKVFDKKIKNKLLTLTKPPTVFIFKILSFLAVKYAQKLKKIELHNLNNIRYVDSTDQDKIISIYYNLCCHDIIIKTNKKSDNFIDDDDNIVDDILNYKNEFLINDKKVCLKHYYNNNNYKKKFEEDLLLVEKMKNSHNKYMKQLFTNNNQKILLKLISKFFKASLIGRNIFINNKKVSNFDWIINKKKNSMETDSDDDDEGEEGAIYYRPKFVKTKGMMVENKIDINFNKKNKSLKKQFIELIDKNWIKFFRKYHKNLLKIIENEFFSRQNEIKKSDIRGKYIKISKNEHMKICSYCQKLKKFNFRVEEMCKNCKEQIEIVKKNKLKPKIIINENHVCFFKKTKK